MRCDLFMGWGDNLQNNTLYPLWVPVLHVS